MRYVSWVHVRVRRLLAVLLTILVYFLLLTVDAVRFFPHQGTDFSSPFRFGFSGLVALLFLAVGALVWLYARDRLVALLLFCFSSMMMVSFAVQTGALLEDPLLSAIGDASSVLSVFLFSAMLLFFPRNHLSLTSQPGAASEARLPSGREYYYGLLLRGYIPVLALLSVIAALYSALHYLQPLLLPGWLSTIYYGYYLLVLTGILVTIIISYRQSSSLRVRQQRRLFVGGVILAFAPLLLLTVLPLVLNLSPQYVIAGKFSALTIGLLPLALGYSILRYQILVFDRYVRRAVAWIVGGIGLVVLGYLVVVLSNVFLSGNTLAEIICIAFAMALLVPLVWWLAHMVTERLFFSEISHYRRLIETPDLLARETFDLDEASELFSVAAVNTFEASEVGLLVLDDDTGCYRLYPGLKDDDPKDDPRRGLIQRLLGVLRPSTYEGTDWVEAHEPVLEHVASAKRPLLLSEACRADEELLSGLSRYLATTIPLEDVNPLLAPVRAGDKMIGMLVLGERGDHQPYAGPDFEAIDLILSRFSPVLETARLYAQRSRHVGILNTLYSASSMPGKAFQSIEEVAVAYTNVAAEAVMARAEVWLYDGKERLLRRIIHVGAGPQLTSLEELGGLQEGDWSSWFYQGSNQLGENSIQAIPSSNPSAEAEVPPCLSQMPHFPFAWLPLSTGKRQYGILALTYPRPHIFSDEEKRVLGMFASQIAATMENAKFTIELRAAYERQKELDRMKDQFITTASHELRTPLTAVRGYIELLGDFGLQLPPEELTMCIEKARHGCDELTLMVENIMNVSRVQVDLENVKLSSVPLAASVTPILEILEAIALQDHYTMQHRIPTDIFVIADDLRLRQVLLNLVGNALKYSPAGSDVEISCDVDDENVTVHIRDYGLGVPLEDQERLFERFMRLERDMNSTARGTGLGLYISKRLIEAMGGRIWIESTGVPGEGSDFIFTLQRSMVTQEMPQSMLERQKVS